MPYAFDAASGSSADTLTTPWTVTFQHTIGGGDDRLLVVASSFDDADLVEVQTVTFNGVPMRLRSHVRGEFLNIRVHDMLEAELPAAGTYDVVVTYTQDLDGVICAAASYSGIADRAPEAIEQDINNAGGTTYSVPITTLTDDALILTAAMTAEDTTHVPDSPGTERHQENESTTTQTLAFSEETLVTAGAATPSGVWGIDKRNAAVSLVYRPAVTPVDRLIPVKVPWTSQPPADAKIDRSHPLGAKAKFAWIGAHTGGEFGRDLVSGEFGVYGGSNTRPTVAFTKYGKGARQIRAGGNRGTIVFQNLGIPSSGFDGVSVVALYNQTDATQSFNSLAGAYDGNGVTDADRLFSIYPLASTVNDPVAYVGPAGTSHQFYAGNGIAPNDGDWHTMGVTKQFGTTDAIGYFDQVSEVSGESITLNAVDIEEVYIMSDATYSGDAYGGDCVFVAWFEGVLSDTEMKSLAANPWQICEPRTIYIPLAAAAAASTPGLIPVKSYRKPYIYGNNPSEGGVNVAGSEYGTGTSVDSSVAVHIPPGASALVVFHGRFTDTETDVCTIAGSSLTRIVTDSLAANQRVDAWFITKDMDGWPGPGVSTLFSDWVGSQQPGVIALAIFDCETHPDRFVSSFGSGSDGEAQPHTATPTFIAGPNDLVLGHVAHFNSFGDPTPPPGGETIEVFDLSGKDNYTWQQPGATQVRPWPVFVNTNNYALVAVAIAPKVVTTWIPVEIAAATSGLIPVRVPWTTQPPVGTPLAKSGMAQKLRVMIRVDPAGAFVDEVTGTRINFNGQTVRNDPKYGLIANSQTTDSLVPFPFGTLSDQWSNDELHQQVIARIPSDSSSGSYMMSSRGGGDDFGRIGYNANGTLDCRVGFDQAIQVANGQGGLADWNGFGGWRKNGVGGIAMTASGFAPLSTAYTGPPTSIAHSVNLFHNAANEEQEMVAFAAWDRILSHEEHKSFFNNPWQVFQPRTIWIPVEGAAATTIFITSVNVTDAWVDGDTGLIALGGGFYS